MVSDPNLNGQIYDQAMGATDGYAEYLEQRNQEGFAQLRSQVDDRQHAGRIGGIASMAGESGA